MTSLPQHLEALVIRAARRSTSRKYRMGCVLFRGPRVLSFGWNRSMTHPKSPAKWRTVHAELDALLGISNAEGLAAAVVRVTRTGLLATSKPCATCWALLQAAGVAKVYYIGEARAWHSTYLT